MYESRTWKMMSMRLPLYEGVDWNIINFPFCYPTGNRSPSLRGSGLKFCYNLRYLLLGLRLPLYEGVDWNNQQEKIGMISFRLPLYEGVDWNIMSTSFLPVSPIVSLFTREWIEICDIMESWKADRVSLFTREWIEITINVFNCCECIVSLFTREWIEICKPDWWDNLPNWSPSLRGSGLK